MKTLKYGLALLVAALLVWTGVWLFVGSRREACPLKLVCLSITNNSAGQSALFAASNSTSRDVVYMADEGSRPCYSLMQYLHPDPHSILGTNYNQNQYASVRPAVLPGHSSVSFEVSVPNGVTGAVMSITYQRQRSRLEEKARSIVESYGRALPSRNPWTTIEARQPLSEQAHPQ